MTRITPLLNDTLNLVQLARETARVQGNQAQAEKLTPVVNGLTSLVNEARDPKAAKTAQAPAPATAEKPAPGVFAQGDFQALLTAAQSSPRPAGSPAPWQNSSPLERNQVIGAMASGGMTDVDIARQMGMTRDEVRLVIKMSQR